MRALCTYGVRRVMEALDGPGYSFFHCRANVRLVTLATDV